MAISAKIDKSRFGTAHSAAYIKVADVANDYINSKGVTILHIYNSVEDYLEGAQCLYKERIESSLENVEEGWGTHAEPSTARQLAYRIGREELGKKSDYSDIVNIFEHGFEGSGSLTEDEQIQLKEHQAYEAHKKEELANVDMDIKKLTQEDEVNAALKIKYDDRETELTSALDNKKAEVESQAKAIQTLYEEMKKLKEEEGDEETVQAKQALIDSAEETQATSKQEAKQLSGEMEEIARAKDENDERIESAKGELQDLTSYKEHLEQSIKEVGEEKGNLIAKDLSAKLTEASQKKLREEAKGAEEKYKLEQAAIIEHLMAKEAQAA